MNSIICRLQTPLLFMTFITLLHVYNYIIVLLYAVHVTHCIVPFCILLSSIPHYSYMKVNIDIVSRIYTVFCKVLFVFLFYNVLLCYFLLSVIWTLSVDSFISWMLIG